MNRKAQKKTTIIKGQRRSKLVEKKIDKLLDPPFSVLSHMLSLNTYGSDRMPDPTLLGLAMCQVQTLGGLVR
jgi:hypothetical protein